MAGKKENIKALFSNTRTRVIILFTVVMLAIAVIVGVFKYSSLTSPKAVASAQLGNAPGLQSVPGSSNPTAQYAALQETQNVQQAVQASKTGSSAIPTIIRTQSFGQGVESVGPQNGEGGAGFQTLAREEAGGPQRSLWLQTLKNGNCSKTSVTTVIQQGATMSDLRAACSCVQLKDDGYKLTDLEGTCTCKELKASGFNARQLKDAGFTAGRLRICGFDACELRGAGFSAQDMKDGGYSDGELKGAGFPENEITRAGGLPEGITAEDVRKAGCKADALSQLRSAGVSAAAIERISGCSASQLKAAGFSAADLKNAGFSAAQLLKAGFTPEELHNAGYSARDLLNAGLTPAQLEAAHYTPDQIKAAETELPPGMTAENVKEAGCSLGALKRERLAGVSAQMIHQIAGCGIRALKEAGFSDGELANAGFSPNQIKALSLPLSDKEIKAAGCDPTKLHALMLQGVSATQIHNLNGCNATALKQAGFDAKELSDAGFTPQQLLAAGFTPEELKAIKPNIPDSAIRAAGCDPTQLKKLFSEGVSAKKIHEMNGCSAEALKEAGFNAKDLADAGFTPAQLLAAGFTPEQLTAAGLNPSAIIAAGRTANCSAESLKAAHALGVSAATIKDTLGCTAKELKDAGYTAAELKAAGFTAADLKDAGFTAAQLKAAGFNAKELKAAGFNAEQLKDAGFTANELKDAGFNAAELKNAGFSAQQLKAAGFSASQLKAAGFSADALRQAGFSAKSLKNAGFSKDQLKNAGFSEQQLQDAGFKPSESSLASLQNEVQPQIPEPKIIIPSIGGAEPSQKSQAAIQAENSRHLQEILDKQQAQMAEQRYQQRIQQKAATMLSLASQSIQDWKSVSAQVYVGGTPPQKGGKGVAMEGEQVVDGHEHESTTFGTGPQKNAIIKAGDVLFAVLDTSVNTDEPGPILATIVSGKLNGSKLIGSFTLPANADKMVISFNTLSVPGAAKTVSISAYAIDPNTARTALASRANNHYLLRYGSLFASTFLEGFGNAFQSANTTISIGGTGAGTPQNTTITNGVGRSVLENAVIGLATLGKTWGQIAQQQFSTPPTVELFSGVGLGILFTQDLMTI